MNDPRFLPTYFWKEVSLDPGPLGRFSFTDWGDADEKYLVHLAAAMEWGGGRTGLCPPGFHTVLGLREQNGAPLQRFGFEPGPDGNCLWGSLLQPEKGDLATKSLTIQVANPRLAKEIQRLWLKTLRLRSSRAELEQAAGLEGTGRTRTWENWEQGRALVYYRAVRLARYVWDKVADARLEARRVTGSI